MSVQVALHPHPATSAARIQVLSVRPVWDNVDRLNLCYRIEGDIDALRLPGPGRAQHVDGLWRGTCFEAFIRHPGARDYLELNLSPSGAWAAYRFDDYRRGMRAVALARPPAIACRRFAQGLEADVEVHLSTLELDGDADLQIALAVVLQDRTGRLSYWAAAHPADAPDFHHPDGFVLTLPRPSSAGCRS